MTQAHKFHVVTSILFLTITLLLVLTGIGYLGLYVLENEPLYYGNIPFPVEPNTLKAGEVFYFDVELCGPEDKEAHMIYNSWLHNIETGAMLDLGRGETAAPRGCTSIDNIPKKLPDSVSPGTYMLHYTVNVKSDITFRVFEYQIKTERFIIEE